MALEIIDQREIRKVTVNYVKDSPIPCSYSDIEVQRPGIDGLSDINFRDVKVIEKLAWVSFIKQAVVTVRHDGLIRDQEYQLPDYPDEKLTGKPLEYDTEWLATERDGTEVEFTPVEEIISNGYIPEYTQSWLTKMGFTYLDFGFLKNIVSLPAAHNGFYRITAGQPSEMARNDLIRQALSTYVAAPKARTINLATAFSTH